MCIYTNVETNVVNLDNADTVQHKIDMKFVLLLDYCIDYKTQRVCTTFNDVLNIIHIFFFYKIKTFDGRADDDFFKYCIYG